MFIQTLSLFRFPADVSWGLDVIGDFGPLLVGITGLGILGLAVLAAIHDSWWEPRQARQVIPPAAPAPDLPKAA